MKKMQQPHKLLLIGIGRQRYIVQPGPAKHIHDEFSAHSSRFCIQIQFILEGWIEELLPGISHMDNQAAAEEEVLQPEAGGHPSVVEEHLVLAVLLKAGLFSRGLSKCVCITLPSLVLGIFSINQSRTFSTQEN